MLHDDQADGTTGTIRAPVTLGPTNITTALHRTLPPPDPDCKSPLHQLVQPLFTQPTAIRQFSTRPWAQVPSHLSNIRNDPLLESDEDDYEISSHGSESHQDTVPQKMVS